MSAAPDPAGAGRADLQAMVGGVMPCCDKPTSVYAGPRGGLSRNYRCAHCGQHWNVSPFHAERIAPPPWAGEGECHEATTHSRR